jgi:hypothetical protein
VATPPQALRRREVASTTVPLILSFGEPIDVSWPGHTATHHGMTSFVAGVHDRPVVTEHGGSQHGIEVQLMPLPARLPDNPGHPRRRHEPGARPSGPPGGTVTVQFPTDGTTGADGAG